MRFLLFALALALPVAAAPVPKSLKARPHVGEWTVEFTNGVVERCSIERDGKAAVADQVRSAGGRADLESGGVVVLTFDDDRTERWTPDGKGYVVDHWYPTSAYPKGTPVRGTAERR